MARMNVLAEVSKGLRANVYAVDNLSPVSRVAVYVKAGSRYEPQHAPGITHVLKASAGLTTQDSSIFGITVKTEKAGAQLKITSDREFIVYRVDCLRHKLANVLGFIDDTIHKPEFRSWELVDVVQPRLTLDLETFKRNQSAVALEALHKAAYRGGLAHSIYAPEHQVSKIKKTDLFDYVEKNFVAERISVIGVGVDETELRQHVEEGFRFNDSSYLGVDGKTRYVGGEARIQANFPRTMVNFVSQGVPISDAKSQAALEVLSTLIGAHPKSHVKYGAGVDNSLFKMLNIMSPHLESSIININHSDTGLFGFSLVGPNDMIMEATRKAVKHVKKVMSNINEKELSAAKHATVARSLVESEDQEKVFKSIALRFASGASEMSPLGLIPKLTVKDVEAVAGQLLKSKPTMVSVGNPRYVPYVDEIDS